jgi:hypothetical protein
MPLAFGIHLYYFHSMQYFFLGIYGMHYWRGYKGCSYGSQLFIGPVRQAVFLAYKPAVADLL